METLTDLFDVKNRDVRIREQGGRFLVKNAVWIRLRSLEEALAVVDRAEARRKACSTHMNLFSSRSHAIFVVKVTNVETLTSSSLFLVDLAGSERVKKSHASGDRLEEAIAINTSLMALSKCIYGISEPGNTHVPFRESKLTKILQETLGGNSKAAVVITVSPDASDVEETISSLKFGQRASKVALAPRVCKVVPEDLSYLTEEQNIEQVSFTLDDGEANSDIEEESSSLKFVSRDREVELLKVENEELKKKVEEAGLVAFNEVRECFEANEANLYE